ncbi:uncharacterized protein [Diadema antillarum]|uniref:uncharacterized protein n=1 Tax=Diadema antillarum TaxID=105358 RepID=UPI003A89B49E
MEDDYPAARVKRKRKRRVTDIIIKRNKKSRDARYQSTVHRLPIDKDVWKRWQEVSAELDVTPRELAGVLLDHFDATQPSKEDGKVPPKQEAEDSRKQRSSTTSSKEFAQESPATLTKEESIAPAPEPWKAVPRVPAQGVPEDQLPLTFIPANFPEVPKKKKRGRPRKHKRPEDLGLPSIISSFDQRLTHPDAWMAGAGVSLPAESPTVVGGLPSVQSARLTFSRVLQQSCQAIQGARDSSVQPSVISHTSTVGGDSEALFVTSYQDGSEGQATTHLMGIVQQPNDGTGHQNEVLLVPAMSVAGVSEDHINVIPAIVSTETEPLFHALPQSVSQTVYDQSQNGRSEKDIFQDSPCESSESLPPSIQESSEVANSVKRNALLKQCGDKASMSLGADDTGQSTEDNLLLIEDGSSAAFKVPNQMRRSRLNQITGGLLNKLQMKAESHLRKTAE